MMKVMEWDVFVEKDFTRRSLKVWVESRGDNADERLNWFFKDGELVHEVRRIQEMMPEGFTPMFSGPVTMMREVIEKMGEAYPSNLFVKRDEYDRLFQEKWELEQRKNAVIKKWEERFDKALDAALDTTKLNKAKTFAKVLERSSLRQAQADKNEDDLPIIEPERPRPTIDEPTALVDTFSFGWRDLVAFWFYVVVGSGMVFMAGRAFRWW